VHLVLYLLHKKRKWLSFILDFSRYFGDFSSQFQKTVLLEWFKILLPHRYVPNNSRYSKPDSRGACYTTA
jgi:hypothetical protein